MISIVSFGERLLLSDEAYIFCIVVVKSFFMGDSETSNKKINVASEAGAKTESEIFSIIIL